MSIDRNTHEQVEVVIEASFSALDRLCVQIPDRAVALSVAPSAMFMAFAAPSQYLKQTPPEQLRYITAGLQLAGTVLGQRAAGSRYGKGRRCAPSTREMAQTALELAKKNVDETNLVVNRKAARDTLLYKHLLEFSCVAKILEPAGMAEMMSNANELLAEVMKSGWLDRNVIKLGG